MNTLNNLIVFLSVLFIGPSQPNSMEGRANKQREKVRRKYEERRSQGYYPQQNRPRINGKQKGTSTRVNLNYTIDGCIVPRSRITGIY